MCMHVYACMYVYIHHIILHRFIQYLWQAENPRKQPAILTLSIYAYVYTVEQQANWL